LIRNCSLNGQICANFIVAPQNAGDEFTPEGAAKNGWALHCVSKWHIIKSNHFKCMHKIKARNIRHKPHENYNFCGTFSALIRQRN